MTVQERAFIARNTFVQALHPFSGGATNCTYINIPAYI